MEVNERIVWPSPGRCIYCGNADVDLTDEHVIPYALTGNSVIFERASCVPCARVINPFEQFVLRQTYGNLRIQIDSPTRNKRSRQTKIDHKFQLLYQGGRRAWNWTVQTDWDRCPVLCPSWDAPLPGIITGSAASSRIAGNKWLFRPDRLELFAEKVRRFFRADGVKYEAGKIDAAGFKRFIAKVAHGYAVAHFGYDAVEWATPAIILGTDPNISHIIGGGQNILPADPDGAAVRISFGHPLDGELPYLLASVRLFEFLGTPEQIVVLGVPKRQLVGRDAKVKK
jgi:5-methylcytosine-specific restriction endonuclease McrA